MSKHLAYMTKLTREQISGVKNPERDYEKNLKAASEKMAKAKKRQMKDTGEYA